MAATFTHREGVVLFGDQPIGREQVNALAAELKDFANAAFFARDYAAYERHVSTHQNLLDACCAANRWAEASA